MGNDLKTDWVSLDSLFTEDEFNNLLIDLWVASKELNENKGKSISAIAGETVTITLTKKDHYLG